jgi:hypothetical protein
MLLLLLLLLMLLLLLLLLIVLLLLVLQAPYGGGFGAIGSLVTAQQLQLQGNRAAAGGAMVLLNPGRFSCSSCYFTRNSANLGGGVATYLTEVREWGPRGKR